MTQASQRLAEISAASAEQAQGVGQISSVVTSMDRVVQTDAASAEESAAAARNATVDDSFVAIYGQEFGTTASGQGHVIIMESPKLFGWEPCSTCTGVSQECADCYFDVYVPKSGAYLTLYQRSAENPSPARAWPKAPGNTTPSPCPAAPPAWN